MLFLFRLARIVAQMFITTSVLICESSEIIIHGIECSQIARLPAAGRDFHGYDSRPQSGSAFFKLKRNIQSQTSDITPAHHASLVFYRRRFLQKDTTP
jgi:hypothetical protein